MAVRDEVQVKDEANKGTIQSLMWVAVFYCGNLSINFYNKWMFGDVFKLPLLVTMSQQIFFFVFTYALSFTPLYDRTPIKGRKMWTQILLIPFVFSLNIGLNNFSFKYITLSANALIRSSNPIAVAILSVMVLSKSYSKYECAAMGLLVAGVLCAVVNAPEFHFFGTMLCVGSMFFSALWSVLVAKSLSDPGQAKLKPFDIMLYCSVPIFMILSIPVQLVGEYEGLMEYVEKDGIGFVLGLICGAGALSWCYVLVVYLFFQHTSALYVSVAATFKIVPLLVFSVMFFHETVTPLKAFGMCIAAAGFMWYTQLSNAKKAAEKAKKAAEGLESGNKKGDTEPLLSKKEVSFEPSQSEGPVAVAVNETK